MQGQDVHNPKRYRPAKKGFIDMRKRFYGDVNVGPPDRRQRRNVEEVDARLEQEIRNTKEREEEISTNEYTEVFTKKPGSHAEKNHKEWSRNVYSGQAFEGFPRKSGISPKKETLHHPVRNSENYDELYTEVFARESVSSSSRTNHSANSTSNDSSPSTRSFNEHSIYSSSEDYDENNWEEEINANCMDTLFTRNIGGNLGLIRCNQAGPTSTEVQLKMTLPVSLKCMDNLAPTKRRLHEAMENMKCEGESSFPKKCNLDYATFEDQVVDMEQTFPGTAIPQLYRSLFESNSDGSMDEPSNVGAKSTSWRVNQSDFTPFEMKKKRVEYSRAVAHDNHETLSRVASLPSEIFVDDQLPDITSDESFEMMPQGDNILRPAKEEHKPSFHQGHYVRGQTTSQLLRIAVPTAVGSGKGDSKKRATGAGSGASEAFGPEEAFGRLDIDSGSVEGGRSKNQIPESPRPSFDEGRRMAQKSMSPFSGHIEQSYVSTEILDDNASGDLFQHPTGTGKGSKLQWIAAKREQLNLVNKEYPSFDEKQEAGTMEKPAVRAAIDFGRYQTGSLPRHQGVPLLVEYKKEEVGNKLSSACSELTGDGNGLAESVQDMIKDVKESATAPLGQNIPAEIHAAKCTARPPTISGCDSVLNEMLDSSNEVRYLVTEDSPTNEVDNWKAPMRTWQDDGDELMGRPNSSPVHLYPIDESTTCPQTSNQRSNECHNVRLAESGEQESNVDPEGSLSFSRSTGQKETQSPYAEDFKHCLESNPVQNSEPNTRSPKIPISAPKLNARPCSDLMSVTSGRSSSSRTEVADPDNENQSRSSSKKKSTGGRPDGNASENASENILGKALKTENEKRSSLSSVSSRVSSSRTKNDGSGDAFEKVLDTEDEIPFSFISVAGSQGANQSIKRQPSELHVDSKGNTDGSSINIDTPTIRNHHIEIDEGTELTENGFHDLSIGRSEIIRVDQKLVSDKTSTQRMTEEANIDHGSPEVETLSSFAENGSDGGTFMSHASDNSQELVDWEKTESHPLIAKEEKHGQDNRDNDKLGQETPLQRKSCIEADPEKVEIRYLGGLSFNQSEVFSAVDDYLVPALTATTMEGLLTRTLTSCTMDTPVASSPFFHNPDIRNRGEKLFRENITKQDGNVSHHSGTSLSIPRMSIFNRAAPQLHKIQIPDIRKILTALVFIALAWIHHFFSPRPQTSPRQHPKWITCTPNSRKCELDVWTLVDSIAVLIQGQADGTKVTCARAHGIKNGTLVSPTLPDLHITNGLPAKWKVSICAIKGAQKPKELPATLWEE